MKAMDSITLENIIQRKIHYYQNVSCKELLNYNTGYIRGLRQMLLDMHLTEDEFLKKYLEIVRNLKEVFENVSDGKIDELSGYNNAIIDILRLLDEKYLYDEEV